MVVILGRLDVKKRGIKRLAFSSGAISVTSWLLAIVLGRGKKGEIALALAHRLIKNYYLSGLEKLEFLSY